MKLIFAYNNQGHTFQLPVELFPFGLIPNVAPFPKKQPAVDFITDFVVVWGLQ